MTEPQLCTASDLTGEPECRRVARWEWPQDDGHPVFLCNFHAEPFPDLLLTVQPTVGQEAT